MSAAQTLTSGDPMPQIKTGLLRTVPNNASSPLDYASDAFERFQAGPKIARPNLAESFIPVIGPAWEAVADLQDGNYAGAAFNGGMAVLDALPVGVALKGARAASKGVGMLKKGSLTANAAQKQLSSRLALKGSGKEIHHTIPLDGTLRNVEDVRNHFMFLKALPKEQHRRLTGSWLVDEVRKPKYDPVRQVWYGTTDWMKAMPVGVGSYVGRNAESVNRERRSR